ncbi:hypothetical protein HDU93_001844 [Gonapodya sp. JEL0774]|nr:hypothetical protein HDU93_001844 [Gonapodya sp. JEL0774]
MTLQRAVVESHTPAPSASSVRAGKRTVYPGQHQHPGYRPYPHPSTRLAIEVIAEDVCVAQAVDGNSVGVHADVDGDLDGELFDSSADNGVWLANRTVAGLSRGRTGSKTGEVPRKGRLGLGREQ